MTLYISGLIVLSGSAVKIRASSVLLCVAASPLLTARMSMQSYPAAVTITVVVSVDIIPIIADGSIVTVTVVVAVAPPSSPTRWVSSSQLSSSAVVAAVGQYITRDVFANHIGQRVSLSAGRPGQFALESCDPLTECVRHNCDCL